MQRALCAPSRCPFFFLILATNSSGRGVDERLLYVGHALVPRVNDDLDRGGRISRYSSRQHRKKGEMRDGGETQQKGNALK